MEGVPHHSCREGNAYGHMCDRDRSMHVRRCLLLLLAALLLAMPLAAAATDAANGSSGHELADGGATPPPPSAVPARVVRALAGGPVIASVSPPIASAGTN